MSRINVQNAEALNACLIILQEEKKKLKESFVSVAKKLFGCE